MLLETFDKNAPITDFNAWYSHVQMINQAGFCLHVKTFYTKSNKKLQK